MADKEQTEAAEIDLTKAASEAIESLKKEEATEEVIEEAAETKQEEPQEQVEQEVAETEEETVEEPVTEDEIQKLSHGQKSQLGRKVASLHRRIDESDNNFRKVLEKLDFLSEKASPSVEEEPKEEPIEVEKFIGRLDPEEPLTVGEAVKVFQELASEVSQKTYSQREDEKAKQSQHYRDTYDRTLTSHLTLVPNDEQQGILEEMGRMTYEASEDAARDCKENFLAAQNAYKSKLIAKLTAPERKIKVKSEKPPKTVTSQKVPAKPEKTIELDDAAKAYLDFAAAESGEEHREKLLKE